MFIHDALNELILCGETEITATDIRIVIGRLGRRKPQNVTGYQEQFQVFQLQNPITWMYNIHSIQDYGENDK